MAPEVIWDPRAASLYSDVYALGVVLYQMLSGKPPFCATAAGAILFKHVGERPPALEEQCPDAPKALCTLLQRMLAKRHLDRPTMSEVGQELLQIERSHAAAGERAMLTPRNRLKLLAAWTAPSLLIAAASLAMVHPSHVSAVRSMEESRVDGTAPPAVPATTNQPATTVSNPYSSALTSTPTFHVKRTEHANPPSPQVKKSREPKAPRSEHLAEARQAYQNRRFSKAIEQARQAVKERPYEAWLLIGQAACMKADPALIREAMWHLDTERQRRVQFECQRNNREP
jgi:serine/threonine protein kinase